MQGESSASGPELDYQSAIFVEQMLSSDWDRDLIAKRQDSYLKSRYRFRLIVLLLGAVSLAIVSATFQLYGLGPYQSSILAGSAFVFFVAALTISWARRAVEYDSKD